MNDVEKFIRKFQTSEVKTVFREYCSYWFAYILYRRFIRDGAVVMYASIGNHFGTKVFGKVYDITGDVTEKYGWEPWLDFGDEIEKERIVRDCIMF